MIATSRQQVIDGFCIWLLAMVSAYIMLNLIEWATKGFYVAGHIIGG